MVTIPPMKLITIGRQLSTCCTIGPRSVSSRGHERDPAKTTHGREHWSSTNQITHTHTQKKTAGSQSHNKCSSAKRRLTRCIPSAPGTAPLAPPAALPVLRPELPSVAPLRGTPEWLTCYDERRLCCSDPAAHPVRLFEVRVRACPTVRVWISRCCDPNVCHVSVGTRVWASRVFSLTEYSPPPVAVSDGLCLDLPPRSASATDRFIRLVSAPWQLARGWYDN